MNIARLLEQDIQRRPTGQPFSYKDIQVAPEEIPALLRALSKLYQAGVLKRLGKGLYYKPEQTQFGAVQPDARVVLNQLLALQKNRISYLTGNNVFNALGLTTQLSKDYVIATDRPRSPLRIGVTRILFVKSRVSEAVADPLPLQMLDALTSMKEIQDAEPMQVCLVIQSKLKAFSARQRRQIAQYALAYPPSTRAVLGLLLENIGDLPQARKLQKSLNPVSTYKTGIQPAAFSASLRWNMG